MVTTDKRTRTIHVIGGGLAGSEAAWQIARAGIAVVLHEMRPLRKTEAHQTDRCAELVCSNSFRSDDSEYNAVGLLHDEMRRLGSLIMQAADANQVPAGGALAVDREGFDPSERCTQEEAIRAYTETAAQICGDAGHLGGKVGHLSIDRKSRHIHFT